MNRELGGVLMLAAAGALAWAYFTGRLDGVIAQAVSRAESVRTAATAGSSGR